jgi:hypothetical protein
VQLPVFDCGRYLSASVFNESRILSKVCKQNEAMSLYGLARLRLQLDLKKYGTPVRPSDLGSNRISCMGSIFRTRYEKTTLCGVIFFLGQDGADAGTRLFPCMIVPLSLRVIRLFFMK